MLPDMVKDEKLNVVWLLSSSILGVLIHFPLSLPKSPHFWTLLLSPLKCSALLGHGGKLKTLCEQ